MHLNMTLLKITRKIVTYLNFWQFEVILIKSCLVLVMFSCNCFAFCISISFPSKIAEQLTSATWILGSISKLSLAGMLFEIIPLNIFPWCLKLSFKATCFFQCCEFQMYNNNVRYADISKITTVDFILFIFKTSEITELTTN